MELYDFDFIFLPIFRSNHIISNSEFKLKQLYNNNMQCIYASTLFKYGPFVKVKGRDRLYFNV